MNLNKMAELVDLARELGATDDESSVDLGSVLGPLIGKYVIVRCRDAGVHAGVLEAADGRACRLSDSRRLWYWKPTKGAFLSACALYGLHKDSKVGAPVGIALTENCEIIQCSDEARASIIAQPNTHE